MTINLVTCPVCNGSKRKSATNRTYKSYIVGYDSETDTIPCTNCGGQYMYGEPTGQVKVNKSNLPCKHRYTTKEIGRCLTQFTCIECGDIYQIDSGD